MLLPGQDAPIGVEDLPLAMSAPAPSYDLVLPGFDQCKGATDEPDDEKLVAEESPQAPSRALEGPTSAEPRVVIGGGRSAQCLDRSYEERKPTRKQQVAPCSLCGPSSKRGDL